MKTDTIDILLLEYLWRKPYYDLSIFNRPEFLRGDNFPYHGLDMKELVERLMRFTRYGLLRLDYDRNFSGMEYIFLTPRDLEDYLYDHQDDYEPDRKKPIDQENRIIYARLSRKGGQIWAEGVQADWERYFIRLGGHGSVIFKSKSKTTLKEILRLYKEKLAVDFQRRPTLNIMRPWNPFRVYWLEFDEGFQLSFLLSRSSQARSVDLMYEWPWRLIWWRDSQGNPILTELHNRFNYLTK